jgi:hypothetical protein
MKMQKNIWIITILVVVTMWLVLHQASAQTAQQPAAVVTDTNTEADIIARYRQGFISKEEAMQEKLMLENKKSLDIYGKVVDQYGQPVVGAKVEGGILLNVSVVASGGESHLTETDANGNFSFVGVHGVKLGIRLQKDGYFYNLKLPSQRPDNYQPDPNNPIIFTMWKIRGAEPLAGKGIESKIPNDGTPVTFDISTGKPSTNGDLRITLSRTPLQVRRSGQRFDWALKIEMLQGSLLPENDPYPYWAPDTGYNPAFNFNMSSNHVPWRSQFTQDFYIKNSQGQFGRMHAEVHTALTPVRVEFNFTANPSGSQNLEPAFSN